MAVHFLTLKQLAEKFGKDLSKKELNAQSVGTTITINEEQIVILRDKDHVVKPKVEKELEEPVTEKSQKKKLRPFKRKKRVRLLKNRLRKINPLIIKELGNGLIINKIKFNLHLVIKEFILNFMGRFKDDPLYLLLH